MTLLLVLRPQFTPALLILFILMPGLVCERRKNYNGDVTSDWSESAFQTWIRKYLGWAQMYVIAPLTLLYAGYPRFFKFAQVMRQRTSLVAVGAVLVVCGIGFTCWALYAIGPNWVGGHWLRQRHQLVVSGPYSLVRHPIYVGFMVFHVGILVATGNIMPIAGDGLFRLMLLGRSVAEERLLAERFGDEYRAYQRRTGRFLPRLRWK